eukprot:TRINITY_DN42255_c0_g1_i1.p1 TRINITY_DN42255_c0_g1~~TRINITY_DN42255_c0_g1_i1.p1  ORF type:complete len:206 (+),score=25.76 TRINITY_DN42255_c0_g1_i1:37-654(+)
MAVARTPLTPLRDITNTPRLARYKSQGTPISGALASKENALNFAGPHTPAKSLGAVLQRLPSNAFASPPPTCKPPKMQRTLNQSPAMASQQQSAVGRTPLRPRAYTYPFPPTPVFHNAPAARSQLSPSSPMHLSPASDWETERMYTSPARPSPPPVVYNPRTGETTTLARDIEVPPAPSSPELVMDDSVQRDLDLRLCLEDQWIP